MNANVKTVSQVEGLATVVEDKATGLPVVAPKAEVANPEVFDANPAVPPQDMLIVTQYMEGKILSTLTEIESKGAQLFQTDRDITRQIQSNLYDCALEACSRIKDQKTVLDLFQRACNASEFKWKELHGIDPKANLRMIDERSKTPVKLVSRYIYHKSVTRFGLGAPRRGETALRTPFPVFNVADDGTTTPIGFDSWFAAVSVAYEKFRETESKSKKATGGKGKKDTVTAPAEDNVPFIPALNGQATRKALVKVAAEHSVTVALNELVKLAGEALEVGVTPELIAEILGDVSDMLRKEIQDKLDK